SLGGTLPTIVRDPAGSAVTTASQKAVNSTSLRMEFTPPSGNGTIRKNSSVGSSSGGRASQSTSAEITHHGPWRSVLTRVAQRSSASDATRAASSRPLGGAAARYISGRLRISETAS